MSQVCSIGRVGVARSDQFCSSACSFFFNNCSSWSVQPTAARPCRLGFSAQCYRAVVVIWGERLEVTGSTVYSVSRWWVPYCHVISVGFVSFFWLCTQHVTFPPPNFAFAFLLCLSLKLNLMVEKGEDGDDTLTF